MRSKKRSKKKFLLDVYNFIKSNERLPTDKECGKSKQCLNYYITELKKNYLIYSPSYSVWKIRPKKEVKKIIVTQYPYNQIYRGHSYQFVIKMPAFEYWSKIKFYLKKKGIKHTITKKNAIRIELDGVKFHLFSKSIVLYFPTDWNFFSPDAAECDALATARAREMAEKLRKYIGIDYRVGGDYNITATRSHKAWINNDLAKEMQDQGQKIFVRYKGKVWLIADKSFNLDELEFIDHRESTRDAKIVVEPFMNKLRDNPEILNTLEDENKRLMSLLEDNQKMLSYLIEKDQKSINIDKFKY